MPPRGLEHLLHLGSADSVVRTHCGRILWGVRPVCGESPGLALQARTYSSPTPRLCWGSHRGMGAIVPWTFFPGPSLFHGATCSCHWFPALPSPASAGFPQLHHKVSPGPHGRVSGGPDGGTSAVRVILKGLKLEVMRLGGFLLFPLMLVGCYFKCWNEFGLNLRLKIRCTRNTDCIYINLNLTLNLHGVRAFQSLCSAFLDGSTNALGA